MDDSEYVEALRRAAERTDLNRTPMVLIHLTPEGFRITAAKLDKAGNPKKQSSADMSFDDFKGFPDGLDFVIDSLEADVG